MSDVPFPTRRVGLIGDPVEHSLSPAFQQPAFDALGLAIRYELWPTPADRFPQRMTELRSGTAIGANVTVPHKQRAFDAVDTRSDRARRAGAVNTIVADHGRLHGENTDIDGFLAPLTQRGFPCATSRAVLLGAGGAARGVAVALLDAGIVELVIVNRTLARAEEMAAALQDSRIIVVSQTRALDASRGANLIVNATSIGWGDAQQPIDPSVFRALADQAIAYDLTYRETGFLRAARDAGVEILDGLEMLVYQGARSFELWTGMPAPVDLMLRCARDARESRAS